MTLPRPALMLALAGLGACVLAVRGCVSVARAQTPDPIAAGISSLDVLATGGGITGPLLALSLLVVVLGKYDLLPTRKPAQERAKADDEPTGAYRPVLTRHEVEAMIDRACAALEKRADEQHERVRETCRDLERRTIAADERARALEPALSPRLANIESGLKELLRDTR